MRLDYSAADRANAWEFTRRFAAAWSRPLDQRDGCAESELAETEARLGRRLPIAVREAYRLLGTRDDLTRNHDRLLQPHELEVDDGHWLVCRVQNQHSALWAVDLTDPDEPDPPTRWRDPTTSTRTWRPFVDRFSQACVEMVLTESLFTQTDLSDNRELDDTAIAALEAAYQPLGFPSTNCGLCPADRRRGGTPATTSCSAMTAGTGYGCTLAPRRPWTTPVGYCPATGSCSEISYLHGHRTRDRPVVGCRHGRRQRSTTTPDRRANP